MFLARRLSVSVLVVMLLAFVLIVPSLARADNTSMVTFSGTVVDRDGGLGVANATVELQQLGKIIATARTDSYGAFAFQPVPAGTYTVLVMAAGYGTVRSDAIPLASGSQSVSLVLQRTQTAGSVRSIGRVVVSSHAAGLQTTTTIQAVADPALAQRTNQLRLAETLGKLPEVNLVGQDSAVGDDIAIDIRGLKQSETQIMLDGHPIGPFGVYPAGIGGGSGGYDFQDSPLGSIESTLVTYGSGAVGLYGVDAIGGSVDMQTLNPTVRPQGQVQYGIGSYGKQQAGAQTTGTLDKLGYAFSYGVTGTNGPFPGSVISQTGTRSTNWDPTTFAGITYYVTSNYNLRNSLAKLRYSFSPSTSLTLTTYTANSWDDKSGNGDDDFITPELVAFHTTSNCSYKVPGVVVSTVFGGGSPKCVPLQEYIQGASGPAGGGGLAWQALLNQDYHARFLTALGKHSIVVDGFADNFQQNYNRGASFLNGPSALSRSPIYRAFGGLISDDIASGNNDFGFGVYNQRQYTNQRQQNGLPPATITAATLYTRLNSYFIRDAWTPTQQLQLFLNAWEKDSLIGGWSFDPRMSVVYRPEAADVIRVTGGASSADPAAIAPSVGSPGGITPGNCQQITIATVPTAGELPEKATDEEFSLAHRWVEDTVTQFTGYETNEKNTIFEAAAPIGPYVGLINELGGAGYIPAVLAHLNGLCSPIPISVSNLFVTSNLNLATARARGFEASQRFRVNRNLVLDGYWDAQSTTFFDAPASLLMNNTTLIPGSQLPGIPLHKWGIYMDATSNKGGELYLNYAQLDSNNELHRPSYGIADMAITQQVGQHTFLNLGASNLFNQAVDYYGRIGLGVFIPENQFGTDTSGLSQGTERFGLAPSSLSFTVIERY